MNAQTETDPILHATASAGLPLPVAVAYSGGADSSALLHACYQLWPGQVLAIHIHHGLQAAGDDFAAHCAQVCQSLQVPLQIVPVTATHASGESPEDAARRARYHALAEAAQALGAASIALAQHADDQVETLLLALSRGAGLPGLAAMPAAWQRQGMHWHRPLLALPGQTLRDWLQQAGHSWVEDPSNTDTRFTRNSIRHGILPALAATLPQFRSTFARSIRHAAEAQALLDELAEQDLTSVGLPPRIAALQTLSPKRQANVLRHWLKQHATQASLAQLHELQKQITACTTRGHRISLKIGHGQVQRHGDHLHYIS